ncbi:membrane protein [Novosphingobium endophyticum]|uniref:Membrane protein n=2 Tax=Novosphingobium endophyticum TaxID=1955250 RepID=A0A916TTF9_9SPHN|nr:AsmA family protein [Novosphingobium endophyticum]GGC04839.1 membrane protein [Novosphingobium endophyticum]
MLALKILGGIIGVVLLLWAVLYITRGSFLKEPFERVATAQLQRKVEVGGDFQLYFAPFNVRFLAEDMSIANPPWARDDQLFNATLIDARIATLTLFSDEWRFNWLRVVDGRAALEWSNDGLRNTWTMGDPNRKGKALDLPRIRRALLAGTVLRYTSPPVQLAAEVRIDTVRASNTRFENDIRFSGGGTLRGDAFTLRGGLLSPNETVQGGRNQLALQARSGKTSLEVTGTLPGATEIEGADLRVVATGPNLSRLFDFLGIAIPETRRYRITSHLTKQSDEWRFTGLRGRFGDSDLAGRLTISLPQDRLLLDADLSSQVLDILDVGPFIGYDPDRLEARGAAGTVEREGGVPRVLPDAPLRTEALRNFDAKVKYAVRRVRAESFPASNIAMDLTLDRSLLTLSPLTFDMSGGSLSSDIEINARQEPVKTTYDVRLSPTPMGRLLASWGVEQSGTTGVLKARAQMTGYGNTVRKSLASSTGRLAVILPKGKMWTRNTELSELDIGTFVQKMFEKKLKEPVQINCGLIAFTVRDGIATADPILIDTRKNVMLGTGRFSFRDERLDLAFRADSKKFSLFSGQSPIGIGGHFVEPKLDVISGELLARAGAGFGLAAAASPIAGIIAFVDIGDAKATDCRPVLAGARAAAQRTTKGEPRDDVNDGKSAKR